MKEVWKVAKPLDRVIHTMGWPLRAASAVPRVRRLVHLPDGRGHGHDRHRRRARLPRRRALGARPAAGAEDAPEDPRRSSRAASACSGARRRSRAAASTRCRSELHAPGLLLCGDGVGMVNVPRAQGRPLRDRVGTARRRGRVRARSSAARRPRPRSSSYDDAVRDELHLERPARGAQHAPGLRPRLLRRRRARERDDRLEGARRAREDAGGARRRRSRCSRTDRAESYPAPDGKLTFDKLSSVFASGNKTRDDQPNHIRIERRVPREVAELWAHMCPAQVYEVGREDERRHRDVDVAPVQLRPVRRDHRQGRPPHAARGRLRPRVHRDLIYRGFTSSAGSETTIGSCSVGV